MEKDRFLIRKPALIAIDQLSTIVENKTTYTLNDCEFSIYETHQKSENVRLHFNELAFTAMLRGKKTMKLQDKTEYFDYLPGETVLVSPGETMVIDFPEADDEPSQCISLSFNPDFIKDSMYYFNDKLQKLDEEKAWKINSDYFYLFNSQSLTHATNNIMRIATENNRNKDLMADLALKELLIRLMQTQAGSMIEDNYMNLRNNSRLAFVVDYIKNNLNEKLPIETLAKLAYVSKSKFFQLFKNEMGLSPNEYILKEKIKLSKKLLSEGMSIKEISFSTGFSDTNHFIKTFKSFEGVTPKLYQRNLFLDFKIKV